MVANPGMNQTSETTCDVLLGIKMPTCLHFHCTHLIELWRRPQIFIKFKPLLLSFKIRSQSLRHTYGYSHEPLFLVLVSFYFHVGYIYVAAPTSSPVRLYVWPYLFAQELEMAINRKQFGRCLRACIGHVHPRSATLQD